MSIANDLDNCASITVQNGISLDDFEFLNPELNANCTNLFLGKCSLVSFLLCFWMGSFPFRRLLLLCTGCR